MIRLSPVALLTRVQRSVKGRMARAAQRLRYRILKRGASRQALQMPWSEGKVLLAGEGPTPWVMRDEQWGHIIHRWANRSALARGEPLDPVPEPDVPVTTASYAADGELTIHVPAETHDEWLYLSLEDETHLWRNYAWRVRFRCLSIFKELQFGFRYRDFYNRYRYRFQDGYVAFDVVRNGQFSAGLSSYPFVIELGRVYELEIRSMGNVFELWIDGIRISVDYDPESHFMSGSIAIIFWEDDGVTDMVAGIQSCSVVELDTSE